MLPIRRDRELLETFESQSMMVLPQKYPRLHSENKQNSRAELKLSKREESTTALSSDLIQPIIKKQLPIIDNDTKLT